MINLEFNTLIDRPVHDVFAFLSNPVNLPRWQSMISEVKPNSSGDIAPGAAFTTKAEMFGRKLEGQMTVIDFQPDEKFTYQGQSGPMTITVEVTIQPVGTGSKVSLHVQGEPGGVFKLAEGALVGQLKNQMDANLARLKSVLESGV